MRRLGMVDNRKLLSAVAVLVIVASLVGIAWLGRPQELAVVRAQDTKTEVAASATSPLFPDEDAQSPAELLSATQSAPAATTQQLDTILVHVDGAVANPGVVELAGADPRVRDAIAACGGLVPKADTSAINLAAKIADGSKIYIPQEGETSPIAGVLQDSLTGQQGNAGGVSSGEAATATGPINLNSASVSELTQLPGVGEATAKRIIEDREAHGPFSSVEDLMRVKGIGEKKFQKLKDKICV